MEMVLVVVAAITALVLIEGAKEMLNRMAKAKARAERQSDRPRR